MGVDMCTYLHIQWLPIMYTIARVRICCSSVQGYNTTITACGRAAHAERALELLAVMEAELLHRGAAPNVLERGGFRSTCKTLRGRRQDCLLAVNLFAVLVCSTCKWNHYWEGFVFVIVGEC